MKKHTCLETLVLHSFLLSIAVQTVDDYPDVILWVGGICLVVLLIWLISLVKKGASPLPIYAAHLAGCIIQSYILSLPKNAFSGLGSGLAVFFYQAELMISLIVLAIGLFIACALRKQNPQ